MKGSTKVVVLGTGTAGSGVITALDKMPNVDLTVVDPRDHYYYNPASVRGLIDAAYAESLWIPLDGILKNGKHILAKAVGVDTDRKVVLLPEDKEIEYDYLVLATGANYGNTLEGRVYRPSMTKAEGLALNQELQAKLYAASEVVVIGGGTVGTETAPELKAAMPGKKITLVHKGPRLISADPDVSEKTSAALLQKLKDAGVDVRMSSYVTNINAEEGTGTITSEVVGVQASVSNSSITDVNATGGQELPSDVQVGPGAYFLRCVGVRPNSEFLQHSKLSASLTPEGYINVDRFLRVQGFKNVFAIGDLMAEEKGVIGVALSSAKTAVKNITALIKHPDSGDKKLKAHATPAMLKGMVISTGPQHNGEAIGMVGKLMVGLKKKNFMIPITAARLKAPKNYDGGVTSPRHTNESPRKLSPRAHKEAK